jgi:hypothetical protein
LTFNPISDSIYESSRGEPLPPPEPRPKVSMITQGSEGLKKEFTSKLFTMNKSPMFVIHAVAVLAVASLQADQPEIDEANTEPLPEVAIYDSDPSHLWNRVHRAFFVRPEADAAATNFDAVDPPLWSDTSSFLKSGSSHAAAIEVLDEFLANDGHALVADPLKRAVLQHDLWAVFDWSANCKTADSEDGTSGRNLADLRSRLADAIRELAMSVEEVAALPDNLAATASAGVFAADYDPEHPKEPFLPGDLFDPDGPWVCIRGGIAGPSAPVHAKYYLGRSPFLVFVQLPGGRQATLDYVNDLNKATRQLVKHDVEALPQFPVGTKTALLRRMTVIDNAGQIQLTPLTQTLQMRVYRQVGAEVTDHQNAQAPVKFRMKRGSLFDDDDGGLEAIEWDEPLRVSLLSSGDIYDHDRRGSSIKTTMQSCIACHSCGGAGTVHSIFTYKQDDWVPGANLMAPSRLRLVASSPSSESRRAVKSKQQRFEWGLLKGLLESR